MMTKFNVGDKVKMPDVSAVMFGSRYFKNGETYEVLSINSEGHPYIGGENCKEEGPRTTGLVITSDEYRAIELVKEDAIMTKFNVGNRVTFIDSGGYSLDDNQQAGVVVGIHEDFPDLYQVAIDNYITLNFSADELLLEKPEYNEQYVLTRLFNAESELEELKSRVKAIESVIADKSKLKGGINLREAIAKAESQTSNQRRADVIKRAQAFVADLIAETSRSLAFTDSHIPFVRERGATTVEFILNSEKRTVAAIARYKYALGITAKGIAKCAPGDVFNADIGKAVALGRALGVKVPKEFTGAVKPTEVVVGHVVTEINGTDGLGRIYKVKDGMAYNIGRGTWWHEELSRNTTLIGLDDTNAVYV